MNRLWLDLGELFRYARMFRRPSGIQRVLFELGQALRADTDEPIGFVGAAGSGFCEIDWNDITAVFAGLARTQPARAEHQTKWGRAMAGQIKALRALTGVAQALIPAFPGAAKAIGPMRPGDTLLVAGAGWAEPGHAARVQAAKQAGLRIALLVHDIIPLRRAEWFSPGEVTNFAEWLAAMLACADDVIAVSKATSADLSWYFGHSGAQPKPISIIRLGDGQAGIGPEARTGALAACVPNEDFVLFVSTLEARKNHAMLITAWRKLIERRGPKAVPLLVLAGRKGALVSDLLADLNESGFAQERIRHIREADDAELTELYQQCRFTVFPSLYEGWGLPVAESLTHGKACFASQATSIPEVGGDLVRLFDPLDASAIATAVETVLRDPEDLLRWEARIRAEYRPTPWSETARQLRAALGSAG
jgi:glycosyltransferase involved in cell wall biosynthesis